MCSIIGYVTLPHHHHHSPLTQMAIFCFCSWKLLLLPQNKMFRTNTYSLSRTHTPTVYKSCGRFHLDMQFHHEEPQVVQLWYHWFTIVLEWNMLPSPGRQIIWHDRYKYSGNGGVEKQLELNGYWGRWQELLLFRNEGRKWKREKKGRAEIVKRKGEKIKIFEERCKSAGWGRPTLLSGHLWHSHLNRLLGLMRQNWWKAVWIWERKDPPFI